MIILTFGKYCIFLLLLHKALQTLCLLLYEKYQITPTTFLPQNPLCSHRNHSNYYSKSNKACSILVQKCKFYNHVQNLKELNRTKSQNSRPLKTANLVIVAIVTNSMLLKIILFYGFRSYRLFNCYH